MLFCHYPPVQGPRTDLEGFSLATQQGGGDGTPSELVKREREGTAASYSAWMVGERTGAGKASYPGDRL